MPKQLSPPILPSEASMIRTNSKARAGFHSVTPHFQRKDPNDNTSPYIATKITFFEARSLALANTDIPNQRRIITKTMDLSNGNITIIKDLDLNDYFTDINSENTTHFDVSLEYTYYDFKMSQPGNHFLFSDYERIEEGQVLKLYDKIISVSQNGNLIEDHETLIREYEGVAETTHMPFLTNGPRWINSAYIDDPPDSKIGVSFSQFFCPPSHTSPIQPQTVVWRKF